MKLYCFYFRNDGTVEKEIIKCRKNKNDYAFKYISDLGYESRGYVAFKNIGKVLNADSYCLGGKNIQCRMYFEEDSEITDEMKAFAEARAEKVKEFNGAEKRFRAGVEELKEKFGF